MSNTPLKNSNNSDVERLLKRIDSEDREQSSPGIPFDSTPALGFWEWYMMPWRKFAVFSGRARRREYWTFALVHFIPGMILTLGTLAGDRGVRELCTLVSAVLVLATIVPNLAVSVRRLHDTGRSGWFLLVGLLPFVGGIILILLMALDGEPNENRYGPDPKTNGL